MNKKYFYLLNNLKNFDKTFRKNMVSEKIKSHKKPRLNLLPIE